VQDISALPEDLWELVRSNSFDLKALNTQLANQRLAREQLEDRLKPNLGLSLSYGRDSSADSLGSAVGGLDSDSLSVGLNWSSKKGERETKVDIAQNQLDLANLELEMQQTELDLKGRLRERQRDLETKAQQIDLAESNLAVTRQTFEITQERANVGLATTLDVIEAQEDVLAAELNLLSARVAYSQTYREILLLAGLI
jgi:outer membrane protein TolC